MKKQTQSEALITIYRAALTAEYACRTTPGLAALCDSISHTANLAYTAMADCIGPVEAGAAHRRIAREVGFDVE